MGAVFSYLASTFLYLGEFLENVFLAVGEIGAVLVRVILGLVVSLCDLLAAISCCCRVPWSERPDRSYYNYQTNVVTTNLSSVGGKQIMASVFTEEGRAQRKEAKEAKKKAQAIEVETKAAALKEKKEAEEKKKVQAAEEKKKAKEEKAVAEKEHQEDKEKEAAAKKAKDSKA